MPQDHGKWRVYSLLKLNNGQCQILLRATQIAFIGNNFRNKRERDSFIVIKTETSTFMSSATRRKDYISGHIVLALLLLYNHITLFFFNYLGT